MAARWWADILAHITHKRLRKTGLGNVDEAKAAVHRAERRLHEVEVARQDVEPHLESVTAFIAKNHIAEQVSEAWGRRATQ